MKYSIEEMEELRVKIKNKSLTITFIPIAGILVYLVTVGFNSFNSQFIIFFGVLGIILGQVFTAKDRVKFNKMYKETFVKTALENIFDNLNYEPKLGIPSKTISDTKMMHMGDTYSSNDYVTGEYDGIHVELADVHMQDRRRDSDGDSHYVTIFQGRWIVFDFNKPFKADIQVCEKSFTNATRKGIFHAQEERLTKVQMEDVEFNKQFKVFAQDDHEAFYILTPSIMQRMKELNSKTDGAILFCFVDNKLHVGLQNGKDSFEHSVFKKINVEEIETKVSKEIREVVKFADELKLNDDLFRREV